MDENQLVQQRISVILSINTLLIQKSLQIQTYLKSQPNKSMDINADIKINKQTAQFFMGLWKNLVQRLHSNLSYIAKIGKCLEDGDNVYHLGQDELILTPLGNDLVDLNRLYTTLQQLFR